MKILLTGKHGQVGGELARSLCALGELRALASADLDLADPDALMRVLRAYKPQLIVNAAAYTAVDKAESRPELAMAVNARAPAILAEEARRLGALLLHYSTDYVFDGQKQSPYIEADPPHPLNVYGHSKLAGEQAIQAVGCRHLILRTSWVYGLRGHNFLLTMRRLLQEGPQVSVVDDQIGVPTWSRWLAEASVQALSHCLQERAAGGLYHLVPAGQASWYALAQAIARHDGAASRLQAITSADYPQRARRPANSCLDAGRAVREFALPHPHWADLLAQCLAETAPQGAPGPAGD